MDLGIRGKVALVTGASSGLGRACALSLAHEGVKLALSARRADLLDSLVEETRAAGAVDARAFVADLSAAGAVEKLCADVAQSLGPIEILLINAGGPKAGTFTKTDLGEWDKAYQLTLMSAVRLAHGVLPGMRAAKWGRIVALQSSSVKQPIPHLMLSNAFRTAVVGAMKTLSIEVAAEGITVNVIATGRFDTARLRSNVGDSDEAIRKAGEAIPIGRVGTPDEFAPMVTFLCGRPAGYITGTTISVDGGLVAGLL